jgi:hypothetical protein
MISPAVLASGAYGYSTAQACEQRNEEVARERVRREALMAQREQAWALTREAAAAARDGDCTRVSALDDQVRAVDAEFHAAVFRRDAAIARCLGYSIR